VGARLLTFARNWEVITDDKWVLNSVAAGVTLDFLKEPRQDSIPCPIPMSKEMEAVCDQEVKDLVLKGAIRGITDDSEGFTSSYVWPLALPQPLGFSLRSLKPLWPLCVSKEFDDDNIF
jgi:hypothetical protein